MKREEQIKQYCADQGFPYGSCSSLSSMKASVATESIKWADKTMIEKVCEWIDENARGYLKAESNIIWFDSVSFRNDLRKVMEE